MLKRELHEEILTRILENVKDGDLTKLPEVTADLELLRKDNVNSIKEFNDLKEESSKLTENNEKLRSANMDLFLKLGSSQSSKTEEKGKEKEQENVSRETLLNEIIDDIGGFGDNEN